MRLALRVRIDPQMVRLVRKMGRLISDEAGLNEHDAMAVEVSIGEALSNTFVHAYDGSSGPVDVEFAREQGVLIIEVRDAGPRRQQVPVVPSHSPRPGQTGRGLYLIGHLMDRIEITPALATGEGTRVRMSKRIPRGRPESFQRVIPIT